MIGPLGLILHMTGTAAVSLWIGFRYGAIFTGKGLKKRAAGRGLQHEWELLIESDAAFSRRTPLANWFSEYMTKEKSK